MSSKRVFLGLALAGFLFGHLGRMLWPASILGRINPLDLLVAITVIYATWRGVQPARNYWLLGFGALISVSVLWGGVVFASFSQWESLFYAVRLVFYVWFILLAPQLLKREGWWIGQWIGVVVSLAGFIQLKIFPAIPPSFIAQYGFDPHSGRLFALFFDPNLVASVLMLTCLLTFGLYERYHRSSSLVALVIQLAALALTVSRSGMLGLAIAAVFVLLALHPRWLIAVLAVGMIGIFLSTTLWSRIVGGVALDATSRARFASWETAGQVIEVNPIVGVGYNYYQAATAALGRYTPRVGQIALAANASDSSLLTIWATTGIFGLLLCVGWLLSLTVSTADRVGVVILRGVVIGLIINSLFINSLLYPFVLFLLALSVASCDAPV